MKFSGTDFNKKKNYFENVFVEETIEQLFQVIFFQKHIFT